MAAATAPRTEARPTPVRPEKASRSVNEAVPDRATYLTLALMREYEDYYDCLAAMEEEAGAARRG